MVAQMYHIPYEIFIIQFKELHLPSSFLAQSLNLPFFVGSTSGKRSFTPQGISDDKVRCLVAHYPSSVIKVKSSTSRTREYTAMFNNITRRDFLGLSFGVPSLFLNSFDAKGAGLPPEEKPRLCDDTCEKELENVW